MTPIALFAGGLAAGLVAGSASCTAVQGGLLIGLTGRDSRSGPSVLASFILGRLASHALAGALLGLLGAAVWIPPGVRAALLVGAGIAVIVFAVRLFGRRAAHAPHPPGTASPRVPPGPVPAQAGDACSPAHGHRGAALWRRVPARPGLLGAATVLIPCGVTLSTEVVAISSGSALGGAAVMAGFVVGTAPAFALLGLLVRRVATTRLVALAAAAALVAGSVTVVAGLRLGGWLPDLGGPVTPAAHAEIRVDGTQVITIWSTEDGYRPGVVAIEAGRPTEIVFRTRDNRGCTRTLTIQGRDVTLPVTGEETVRLPAQRPGTLRYICGMGMYVGFINITQPGPPNETAVSTSRQQLS